MYMGLNLFTIKIFCKEKDISNVSMKVITSLRITYSCMLGKNKMSMGKTPQILFFQVNK